MILVGVFVAGFFVFLLLRKADRAYDENAPVQKGVAGPITGAIAIIVAAIVLLIIGLSLWPLASVPRDKIALSYGGGWLEGAHFQGLHQPGQGTFFNGWGDRLYEYPVTQRNYIISKRAGEGDIGAADSVHAVTADNVAVEWEVATYFKLNTDKVQKFHEQIGLKYHAYDDEGWDRMLNDSFRQQIENALQEETRRFSVSDIYSNKDALLQVQENVGSVLKERVADVLGDNYFCGPTYTGGRVCPPFTFVVKRITVPEQVKAAFEKNRTSLIEVQTKENEVKQAKAEAEAIAATGQALRDNPQYALLQAIKSGNIKFWVLPSDGTNLTLPAQP